MRIILLAIGIFVACSASGAAQQKAAPQPAAAAPAAQAKEAVKNAAKDAKASAAPADDAAVTAAAQDKLSKTPSLKTATITASVKNGVATLTGKVKNPGLKGVATNVVKRVSGVKSVTNQLEIEKEAGKGGAKK